VGQEIKADGSFSKQMLDDLEAINAVKLDEEEDKQEADAAPPADVAAPAAPPADGAVAPPAAPPADGAVAPPADGVVAPPGDGAVAPPGDGAVAPPADGAVAPPADGAAPPAGGDGAAPPADAAAPPADGAEDDATPKKGKKGKKGKGPKGGKGDKKTPKRKRGEMDVVAMEYWKTVPPVYVMVNAYDDEEGGDCESGEEGDCNIREAIRYVENRQGFITVPTAEVYKLKKGPIILPQYSHITITSQGTEAQKKAIFYHRESLTFTGGNNALFVVPENTSLALDSVAFKNNPRRSIYGDHGAEIYVKNSAFVNNTCESEGAAIKVDFGSLIVEQTLFYNNSCGASGGGIYTTGSNVTVVSSNFLNNTAASGSGFKAYKSKVSHIG